MKKMIIFAMVLAFVLTFNGLVFAEDDSSGDFSTLKLLGMFYGLDLWELCILCWEQRPL